MEETPEEWEKTIHESRHSRYPICDETADNVVGILNVKDYFRLEDKSRESVMKNAVYPAYFVPETVRADVLLRQMKESRNHFAIVLDEYGGTLGVVTIQDLLEQLVGDLEDDVAAAEEQEPITQMDSGTWRIAGIAPLSDVEEAIGVSLPTEEYDTFGGLVFGCYGSVPDDGTTFEIDFENLHIKVNEIRDHRLENAIVCRIEPEPEEEEKE